MTSCFAWPTLTFFILQSLLTGRSPHTYTHNITLKKIEENIKKRTSEIVLSISSFCCAEKHVCLRHPFLFFRMLLVEEDATDPQYSSPPYVVLYTKNRGHDDKNIKSFAPTFRSFCVFTLTILGRMCFFFGDRFLCTRSGMKICVLNLSLLDTQRLFSFFPFLYFSVL